jgi:hypothetical protein
MGKAALPCIVVICSDPGAGNAVAPVIEALHTEGRVTVKALAYRETCALWAKRHLTFDKVDEGIPRAALGHLLGNPKASLLLTGTSHNSIDLEREFIAVARKREVPSLAVLDFWSNYVLRFSDGNGHLGCMPDRIAVMDEWAREEMVAAGFDPGRLVITGQPALDDLALLRSQFTLARRQVILEELGARPDEFLVLFASQPLSYLYGTDRADPLYPGFDERGVLDMLLIVLDQLAEEKGQRITFIIRPHPREKPESFSNLRSKAVRIVVSKRGEPRDLALAADLVIGMNSMLLVETCYLGCLTVSLQPGLRLPDTLPTNRLGLSRAIYRKEEVKPVLEEMIFDKQARMAFHSRLSNLRLDGGAAGRVARLVYQMIGMR